MPVRPPARPPAWKNSATAERVFVKYYVGKILLKSEEKIKTLLKWKNVTELLHGLRTYITILVTGVTMLAVDRSTVRVVYMIYN